MLVPQNGKSIGLAHGLRRSGGAGQHSLDRDCQRITLKRNRLAACAHSILLVPHKYTGLILLFQSTRPYLHSSTVSINNRLISIYITAVCQIPGFPATYIHRRQGRIRGFKAAVDVVAVVGGVHYINAVTVSNIPLGHGIFVKALVGTPVVQGAHPATALATAELAELYAVLRAIVGDDGTDVALLAAQLPVAFLDQGPGDNGHHSVGWIDILRSVEALIYNQVSVGAGVRDTLTHAVFQVIP